MKNLLSKLQTTQIIMLGYVFTILVGALLLMMPFSSAKGEVTGFIDSLFTSTSAVCITGLVTLVTSEHWSIIGQIIIMALIQIGGLGFMGIVTIVFLALGKRITMRERAVIQESFNINEQRGIIRFAKYIFKFTLVFELMGAIFLAIRFVPRFGLIDGIYKGIFHSISAFCNAGFDILGSDSLMGYTKDYIINITIMVLIVTGGIGFPVIEDLYSTYIKKKKNGYSLKFSFGRLRLHTKIALTTTAIILVVPAILIFIFEFTNKGTMADMGIFEKIVASFFQSVTVRTAGYAGIDQGAMTYSSKIISIVCMFIGGSPAGTAGGAKTVTVAILIISVASLVAGRDEVCAFNRKIGLDILQKALSVVIMMLAISIASVMVLSVTEAGLLVDNGGSFELLDIVYEVVSAIATVGLTTGVTPHLSALGKLVITLCMYLGKVGPISLAIALTVKSSNKNLIHYPEGNIIVG